MKIQQQGCGESLSADITSIPKTTITQASLMAEPTFPKLWQELTEKIHHVDFCFSQNCDLIRDIDMATTLIEMEEEDIIELDNRISEAKAFILTGYDTMEDLKGFYQDLFKDQDREQFTKSCSSLMEDIPFSFRNKDLLGAFQEAIERISVCLFHATERTQEIGKLLGKGPEQDPENLQDKMVMLSCLVQASHEEMQQIRELYQVLKEKIHA